MVKLYPALFFLLIARMFELPLRSTVFGLALVVGAVIVAGIQSRWYSHHLFPITVAYIAWWWMARSGIELWAHGVAALLIAMPIIGEFRSTATYQAAVNELDLTMQEAGRSVGGKRVGLLTMHPSPFSQYLASNSGLRWNTSVNNAYVAAELQRFDTAERGAGPPLSDHAYRTWSANAA